MPVIATLNIKSLNIFNTMEFIIEDIDFDKKEFKINNNWYEESQFKNSLIISFCSTVYKYQGGTIDQHYNIFDCERMGKKQLYTSLSRTTKFDYIHLDNKTLNKNYYNRKCQF